MKNNWKNHQKIEAGGFETVRGQIPEIFFFYFWILSKNGASSEGIFLIGGLTKKIKKIYSQFSGADFSLVIDFWIKWTSIP